MDSKKDIKIKGRLSLGDYTNLNKSYMKTIFKKMIGIVLVSFLVLYGILFYKRYGIVFVGVASFLGTLFVYVAIFVATTFRARKNFKSASLSKYDFTYTINKNGIHVQSERGGRQYFWKDIIEATELNDLHILYISKAQSILIPRRFFNDESQISDFKEMLTENVISKTK